jgi:3-oxoacyl-[acyl-carrier-protein] synthase-3
MVQASAEVLAAQGRTAADIDLLVPHQANLRIIEAVAHKLAIPTERAFINVHRYGNMSAATVPVALVEALEAGRVRPGAMLLLPAFGAGLSWCAHLARWGERVAPVARSEAVLPPASRPGLALVQDLMRQRERVSG